MYYEKKTKMIGKGTSCYKSEMGHYNFLYPNMNEEYFFSSDSIITELTWPSLNGLVAVNVINGVVEKIPRKEGQKLIVWVDQNTIRHY